ncbi:MAG: hypothetical protein JW388_0964 [Nitrospira sp.]|nr:hypothetical protein [Nitrospira sp.]
MTPDKFNQIIKNRTAERVKECIDNFERKIQQAFADIGIQTNSYRRWAGGNEGQKAKAVMRHLLSHSASEGVSVGYPQKLWDDESAAVTQELLHTLDEMAKALAAKPAEPLPINTDIALDSEAV